MSSTLPTTSGIYRITCTITGKFYIGSANNIAVRAYRHLHALRSNTHHSVTMQRAFSKYGQESFTFEVVELVLPMFLLEREQYWLDNLKPFNEKGFNIARSAQSFHLGMKATPETIERLRMSHLGKRLSDETKQKLSDLNKDKQFSLETRERIRLAKLGKTRSPETIAKMSASKTGHKPDPKIYDARRKTLIVTSPDGTEYVVTGIRKFCEKHNLDTSSLMRVAKGAYSHHKGWLARFP